MSEEAPEVSPSPEFIIARSQEIIHILRETNQGLNDELVTLRVENRFLMRHINQLENQIELLNAISETTEEKELRDDREEV